MGLHSQEKYRLFCNQNQDMPLFLKDWWLDAASGESGWDVAISEKGNLIFAYWPYCFKKKFGFSIITMPPLTPFLHILFQYPPDQKYQTRLRFEKETLHDLITQLPPHAFFIQKFHYDFTNWLPFYWENFRQTTHYSYVLDMQKSLPDMFNAFSSHIKTDIRKSESKLQIVESPNPDPLFKFVNLSYLKSRESTAFSLKHLHRIYDACSLRQCCKIFLAEDARQQIHGGVMIVWDSHSAYYLLGGSDPKLRSSGVGSFLVWHAIQFAKNKVSFFDFEGGMVEPIEHFFRGFGGALTPYFQITKCNNPLLAPYLVFRGIL